VCGAALTPAAPGSATLARPGGGCPECGEPRAPDLARYCEVCRFDFVAGRPGPPPGSVDAAPAQATRPLPPRPAPPGDDPPRPDADWEIVISLDAALDAAPDPGTPFPAHEPERRLALGRGELLIGRRDERRDIKPDVELPDPGASRRHAKVLRLPDGSIQLHDLASANGTRVNGVEVPPGARQPLRAGDVITLGRWSRLVLRARR
jgi:hypothetical protein